MIAVAAARATTNGVYTRANFVIKRSACGLLAAAFSTESRILVTMDSESSFSTRIFKRPEVLTQPEVRVLPIVTDTGTGSPVIGEVSMRLSPSTTTPSRGMRSPGRICTIFPTAAEPAGISRTVPFSSRRTVSGRRSTASMIWLRLFSTARCSNASPTR